MKITLNQSQLLKQLNIRPLYCRPAFIVQSISQPDNIAKDSAQLPEPQNVLLSHDISLLLAQSTIINWLIDPATQQCRFEQNNSVLITPDLVFLKQPELKQQLWALVQQQLTDNAN
jgi:hypothetical protein